jgi:hypothetical protein
MSGTGSHTTASPGRLLRTTLALLGGPQWSIGGGSHAGTVSPSAQMLATCWFLLNKLDATKAKDVQT